MTLHKAQSGLFQVITPEGVVQIVYSVINFMESFLYTGLPLESCCFENKRIVQEDQKTICVVIELLIVFF